MFPGARRIWGAVVVGSQQIAGQEWGPRKGRGSTGTATASDEVFDGMSLVFLVWMNRDYCCAEISGCIVAINSATLMPNLRISDLFMITPFSVR